MTISGSLDANVVLRLLLNDVPEQHEAVLKLLDQASGQFVVADTAIMETVFALSKHYGLTRAVVVEAIRGLMSLTEIKCNQVLFEKALPLYARHPKLSFEDCCLASYAELTDASPLWTFDRKLANQTTARLIPL